MKKIFVVSTLYYQRLEVVLDDLLKELKKENPQEEYEFYIVNENYGCEAPTNVKYNYYISTHDSTDDNEMKKIYDCVREWPICDYSIQTDEYAVTILGLVNSELGLPGLTLEEEHKFRDKVKMKQNLKDDVNKPELYTLDDVENDRFSYPVIIKPRTFAASKGVCLINNKEELLSELEGKYVDYTRPSIDTMEDYEIEQYIGGDVYHIDGIVFNGEIVFCVASRYIGSCFNYAHGKLLGSMKATDTQQKQAISFAKKVHRDLKIPDGVFHLESFYHNEDFVFLEIGIRPGGGDIVPAIKVGTGIDLAKEHIKCQLGLKPDEPTGNDKFFGWLNFPCIHEFEKEQYVKSVTLPNFTPESLYSSNIPKVGDKATCDFVHYGISLGSFVFLSDDRKKSEEEMQLYAEEYKVVIE